MPVENMVAVFIMCVKIGVERGGLELELELREWCLAVSSLSNEIHVQFQCFGSKDGNRETGLGFMVRRT